jgi:adenosylhomocysteine nucleosidase
MAYKVIGLIAAMPEEIKPLLQRIGACCRETIDGFDAWRFNIASHDICLVMSGMGHEKAGRAGRALIAATGPDLLISFGFAGAVTAGLGVGDIVVARRILLNMKGAFPEQPGLAMGKAEEAAGHLAGPLQEKGVRVRQGTFITAAQIMDKRETARLLPAGSENPVLEMETAAVAQAACACNVPLIAVRAVSDGAEEDLGFSIEEFCDREMNIRPWKVLLTAAKKPRIVPQLIRLAKGSRIAGKNLATALTVLLEALQ